MLQKNLKSLATTEQNGIKARKHGKTKAGKQRWLCINCNYTFCNQIDSTVKDFQSFLNWLFSKTVHKDMPGEGCTFRRRTAKFWRIWPMPPKVEEPRDIFIRRWYSPRQKSLYWVGMYVGTKIRSPGWL